MPSVTDGPWQYRPIKMYSPSIVLSGQNSRPVPMIAVSPIIWINLSPILPMVCCLWSGLTQNVACIGPYNVQLECKPCFDHSHLDPDHLYSLNPVFDVYRCVLSFNWGHSTQHIIPISVTDTFPNLCKLCVCLIYETWQYARECLGLPARYSTVYLFQQVGLLLTCFHFFLMNKQDWRTFLFAVTVLTD